ncbi:MAG: FAD-dependent oxidoreductase [Desulfobacterales bacterium]
MNKKIGKALVVGAGIGGIRAALDLAEYGYGVTLIDRSPHLGGILSQLDYQFSTNRCGMCKMLPLVNRDAGSQYCLRKGLFHENIDISLSTELVSIAGEPGHFQITLKQHPNWVDPDRCMGCGDCVSICPVEVPDEFNAGLGTRKAIYLPVPHTIPNPYIIDYSVCTRCGECQKICPTAAIQIPDKERKGFRILVVDDELIVRDSLKAWLEEEGYAVDMAASGQDALDQLTGQAYQLMLLDLKMPGMDGVEVLKKTKEVFPDLEVIMMTAYATVETAVEAMKIGARDYLLKPFDPETLIPMAERLYQEITAAEGRQIEVGAVVLSGGTAFFDPAGGKNTFGYGIFPNVVTGLEFERILSGTGPCRGHLVRPVDGKPLRKIAWIQCVGSRDLQLEADYCSNICCMAAIKEALVAKEKAQENLDTAIFYMDMRTFGKSFQRYREQAEVIHGVRFIRARVHTVNQDAASNDLILRSVDISGKTTDERFDMVVLSVGQRPAAGADELAQLAGIELNPSGFAQTESFSLTRTSHVGIEVGGSFAELKDISESVTQGSAAALNASRIIHASGGSLALEPSLPEARADVSRELPKILVIVCTCGARLSETVDTQIVAHRIKTDPLVDRVLFVEQACTASGWEQLEKWVEESKPNRILIGACMPYAYKRKINELSQRIGLDPALIDVVDLGSEYRNTLAEDGDKEFAVRNLSSKLDMGVAKLKWVEPSPLPTIPITQRALVVGGGIGGMTAALAIADHGFEVDLVEQNEQLGGNLNWIERTLDGNDPKELMENTRASVKKHPQIQLHLKSRVVHSIGEVGNFHTTIEDAQNGVQTLRHGVAILATGGTEAATSAYGYGSSPAIMTQKELEQKLAENTLDPAKLNSVVMIQCVDSREEPRNYCSRVCCATALKHALYLKEKNNELQIYVLYRDMMTYGFTEAYYTRARKANVIFIQYAVDEKPRVETDKKGVKVMVRDALIEKQIQIEADLLVLATGIVPSLPRELAETFGVVTDQDGFFQEADPKWRPLDALKEGVFCCGLAHSPRNIAETIATAEAAAQRALRILSQQRLSAGKVVANVHHSLCSLCERCIDACPYGARSLNYEMDKVLVNPAMCQGCGSCAAICPNGASVLEGFLEQQMLEMIDAAIS